MVKKHFFLGSVALTECTFWMMLVHSVGKAKISYLVPTYVNE